MIDWGLFAILMLGILLGGIAFSATFRKKFFVWFRSFIFGKKGQKKDTGIRRVLAECPKCEGLGRMHSPEMRTGYRWEKCLYCNGTGEVEVRE